MEAQPPGLEVRAVTTDITDMRMTILLGLLGLATRRDLQQAVDRKNRWHGLVRDVFAQYYLKFREVSLGYMPAVPRRYSPGWEASIRLELEEFRNLDLDSVAKLLDSCGFGTDRWERIKEAGFPALKRLIEEQILTRNGDPPAEGSPQVWLDRVETAVAEDLQHLMAWHPDALIDLISKVDLDTGQLILSEGELQASQAYRDLTARLAEAEYEIKKLRTGGRRALARMKALEAQVGSHPPQLARADSSTAANLEDLAEEMELAADPAVAQMAGEIRELANSLRIREHTIDSLREQVAKLEAQLATRPATPEGKVEEGDVDLAADIQRIRHEARVREHAIEGLQEQLQRSGDLVDQSRSARAREAQEYRNDVETHERTVLGLREQVDRLETQLDAALKTSHAAQASGTVVSRLTEDNKGLRRDVRAREKTIAALRDQLHQFEEELGQGRDQLLSEIEKLTAITSGETELKPSEELANMDSDELLGYARELAEDLDVRQQTLKEGLDSIDTVKDSFEGSKQAYETQQRGLQGELESLRSELAEYEEQQRESEEIQVEGSHEAMEVIATQRRQLNLLSTRVKQLIATNQDLDQSNRKTYSDLENAVRRMNPLRQQVEQLQSLQEALERYVRQTHDRTFTVGKLQARGF